jgi:hypothetical protein
MEHVNFMLDDQRKFKNRNLVILLYRIAKYLHNIYIDLILIKNLILTKNTDFFYFKWTRDKSLFGSIKELRFIC